MRSISAPVRFSALLPLLLGVLLCGGCFRSKDADIDPAAYMSAEEFACQFYLQQITPSVKGSYGFDADGKILLLYPGMNTASFDGKVFRLPVRPVVSAQGLLIPRTAIAAMPKEITSRTAKPRTGRQLVIIDAGHGGNDPGARAGGLNEKDIALDIARMVERELSRQGIEVRMTRNSDVFLTLQQRANIANLNPGAVFVSIHANASNSPTARGIETFYIADRVTDASRAQTAITRYHIGGPQGNLSGRDGLAAAQAMCARYRKESQILAGMVQNQLIAATRDTDRGVKQDNFAVLRESFFGPAILVEVGFMTHPPTLQRLGTSPYRQQLAQAIARGVGQYLAGGNGGR